MPTPRRCVGTSVASALADAHRPVRGDQAGDDARQRRLAASGRAEQTDGLAGGDGQRGASSTTSIVEGDVHVGNDEVGTHDPTALWNWVTLGRRGGA